METLRRQLLEASRVSNISLSNDEFRLGQQVSFGGHIVSDKGTLPDPERVAAIQDFPVPKNNTELESFMGMCNQFSTFTADLSQASAVAFWPLLQKNVPFVLLEKQLQEFQRMKDLLSLSAAIHLFDPALPTELHTDVFNDYSYRYVLLQMLPEQKKDGTRLRKMVRCCSRNLASPESR